MQHKEHGLEWLQKRGITTKVIDAFSISVADVPSLKLQDAIIIPVRTIDGEFSFNKYRRNPIEGNVKPKYLYDRGGKVTLYGADQLVAHYKPGTVVPDQEWNPVKPPVILTEGELDTLVCWSQNIAAVSSTGGALSFQPEWADLLKCYSVYICFDNDEAGMKGAIKVLDMLPSAKVIIVPNQLEVKDISDYVSRGGNVHDLLKTAFSVTDLSDAQVQFETLSASWRLNEAKFFELYIEHQKEKRVLPSNTSGQAAPTSTSDDRLLRAKSVDGLTLLPFVRKGRYPVTTCLWHNDHDPSFTWYKRNNSGYCHVCGKYADVIDITMAVHGLSGKEGFKRALTILLKESD